MMILIFRGKQKIIEILNSMKDVIDILADKIVTVVNLMKELDASLMILRSRVSALEDKQKGEKR